MFIAPTRTSDKQLMLYKMNVQKNLYKNYSETQSIVKSAHSQYMVCKVHYLFMTYLYACNLPLPERYKYKMLYCY